MIRNYLKMDQTDYVNYFSQLTDEERESIGDDPTSCWCYAYVFAKIMNFPIHDFDPIFENRIDKKEFKLDRSGKYICFYENEYEMHYFVIIVNGDISTIYSTYGKYKYLIQKDFNTSHLEILLQNLSSESFTEIFGIVADYVDDYNCDILYTFRE